MHPADLEVWRAIDRGEREVDWLAWFGHPDGADYLTDPGKRLVQRAAADLTSFFGPRWLPRAIDPSSDRHIGGLGVASPVLALTPGDRVGAYVESIRWWASLQLLIDQRVPGMGVVRRLTRTDITTDRLAHTLTQARLAAVGGYLGAHVVLEPAKEDGPGDVLLRIGERELFIEVATSGPGRHGEQEDRAFDQHVEQLVARVGRRGMHWEGDLPGLLNRADEDRWLRSIDAAADSCEQNHESAEVRGSWGCLVVKPGTLPEGGVTGPTVERDLGTRLLQILDDKADQTRAAGVAWIWIEDAGGTHITLPFTSMSPSAKLDALSKLLEPALQQHPHLAGVVWSRQTRAPQSPASPWLATSPREPSTQKADAESHSGIALQRHLPVDRLRETVIINNRLILPEQLRTLMQLCNREPGWLDWALTRLGVPGGLRSLLSG